MVSDYDTLPNECETTQELLGWIEAIAQRSPLTMRRRFELIKMFAERGIEICDAPLSETKSEIG